MKSLKRFSVPEFSVPCVPKNGRQRREPPRTILECEWSYETTSAHVLTRWPGWRSVVQKLVNDPFFNPTGLKGPRAFGAVLKRFFKHHGADVICLQVCSYTERSDGWGALCLCSFGHWTKFARVWAGDLATSDGAESCRRLKRWRMKCTGWAVIFRNVDGILLLL